MLKIRVPPTICNWWFCRILMLQSHHNRFLSVLLCAVLLWLTVRLVWDFCFVFCSKIVRFWTSQPNEMAIFFVLLLRHWSMCNTTQLGLNSFFFPVLLPCLVMFSYLALMSFRFGYFLCVAVDHLFRSNSETWHEIDRSRCSWWFAIVGQSAWIDGIGIGVDSINTWSTQWNSCWCGWMDGWLVGWLDDVWRVTWWW